MQYCTNVLIYRYVIYGRAIIDVYININFLVYKKNAFEIKNE